MGQNIWETMERSHSDPGPHQINNVLGWGKAYLSCLLRRAGRQYCKIILNP